MIPTSSLSVDYLGHFSCVESRVDICHGQNTQQTMYRERVLTAEGEKKAYTLQSEGVKIQLINESEGRAIEVQNAATAKKEKIRIEAEVK